MYDAFFVKALQERNSWESRRVPQIKTPMRYPLTQRAARRSGLGAGCLRTRFWMRVESGPQQPLLVAGGDAGLSRGTCGGEARWISVTGGD